MPRNNTYLVSVHFKSVIFHNIKAKNPTEAYNKALWRIKKAYLKRERKKVNGMRALVNPKSIVIAKKDK